MQRKREIRAYWGSSSISGKPNRAAYCFAAQPLQAFARRLA
jgi:hypothetical protein